MGTSSNNHGANGSSSHKQKVPLPSLSTFLLVLVASAISFMAGTFQAFNAGMNHCQATDATNQARQEGFKIPREDRSKQTPLLPATVRRFATGIAHTPKGNFTSKLNFGVPIDPPELGTEDVLVLYSQLEAMPHAKNRKPSLTSSLDFVASADDALENCEYVNVIFTHHEPNRKQCVAIVPQYESFHVQKYMRLPENKADGELNKRFDLRPVPRGMQPNGHPAFMPPKAKHTLNSWELLKDYMTAFDDVVAELKPIAEKIAEDNNIIVMVVNHGQSELMLNFACNARAKGLDTSNVLIFATDEESKSLAESVGLTAYYDHRNFDKIPSGAAEAYGDRQFVAMMMAKVNCVHLINHLGYNVLFQDVDLIWYKNPLEFFKSHDPSTPIGSFDVYFQDDGSHSTRYSPFAANSGFYYVRANDLTRYFLTALLMSADVILQTHSHQQAMTAILAEHSSLYGLKVKVFGRDDDDYGALFPGGFHYHKRRDYMQALVKGEVEPYIFHMCWTKNKENKLKFFQQMDQWYLQDQCIAKTPSELGEEAMGSVQAFTDLCCAKESLFSCHYNDKPSTRPCKDSPALDKHKKPSFW